MNQPSTKTDCGSLLAAPSLTQNTPSVQQETAPLRPLKAKLNKTRNLLLGGKHASAGKEALRMAQIYDPWNNPPARRKVMKRRRPRLPKAPAPAAGAQDMTLDIGEVQDCAEHTSETGR